MDTSVLASALRSSFGASYRILLYALDGKLKLVATPALFLEYEAVLSRPEQMAVHGFTLEEVGMILEDLAAIVEPVEIYYQWRPQLNDPNDELVLEAALNGRADIVTHNVRDFAGMEGIFNVRVRRPGAILEEMKR